MMIFDNFAYFFIKTYVDEAILMSTHNIGFYEDLTKIIFELSSNIIKYAPYFFYCHWCGGFNINPLFRTAMSEKTVKILM